MISPDGPTGVSCLIPPPKRLPIPAAIITSVVSFFKSSSSSVFGSYYTYCIGITKYHGGDDERGKIENVTIENLFASLSEGTPDVKGGKRPILWVQKGLDVDGLSVSNARRVEKCFPNPFLIVEENMTVKNLRLRDISQRSELGTPIPLMQLDGVVELTAEENLSNS